MTTGLDELRVKESDRIEAMLTRQQKDGAVFLPDEAVSLDQALRVMTVWSARSMGEDKIKRHMATGAEYVTGPDSSCLMHMAGIAKKEKMPIKFIHVVQILAAGL